MSSLLALYLRTFAIGVFVAAPVGAMGVLCIQRTLDRGWLAGMATGLGIASADGTYAACAAFGVAALSTTLVTWQTPLRLIGGAVLVYLGVRSMRARQRDCVADNGPAEGDGGRSDEALATHGYSRTLLGRGSQTPPVPGLAAAYVSAVGLTLTNPLTIMAFGAVFASAGLVAQPGIASAATATAGIASGSLSWWLVLVTGVTLARHAAGPRLVTAVSRVSGAVIVGFGLIAMGSALWPLVAGR
jgi:putative LysE/RhtB family amino acid efflux pump